MRRPRWFYPRLGAALLLAAYIPACTGYQTLAGPPVALEAAPIAGKEVRVTLRDGRRLEFKSPQVLGDSLRGAPVGGPPMSVALADIRQVEVKKVSAGKTVALVAGVLVIGGLVAAAIVAASDPLGGSCTIEGDPGYSW
jgi:hypothetical protein